MTQVIVYTKKNCPLCEEALSLLSLLQHDYAFNIEERDIHMNDEWLEKYQLQIPYIQIEDVGLNAEQMNIDTVEDALKRAGLLRA